MVGSILQSLLIGLLVTCSPAGNPIVDIPSVGVVKGNYVIGQYVISSEPTNISAFHGIPFAKPPVGDLRWRSPQAREPWTSVWDGTKNRSCCMQNWPTYLPPNTTELSEDCLYLNVFSPTAALNGEEKLSVMFWIHGGAYDTGCGIMYPGMGIVNYADLNVVTVTTNYRLNVFGFLASNDLKSRTKDGSIGNYGIEDQRFAIQWVVDNIGAFGGNSEDITIFGESAGGSSVINHLTQTASFPLYKKAIIESGTYQGSVSLQQSEGIYDSLKKDTECNDVDCLVKLPAEELTQRTKLQQLWGPTVDGVVLADEPYNLIRQGKFNNKVPIMLGSNRDEAAFFVMIEGLQKLLPPKMGEAELDALLVGLVGLGNIGKVKELYQPSNYDFPPSLGNYSIEWFTAVRVMTDSVPGLGACGARNFSQNFHKSGTPALFTYLFAHPTQRAYYMPGSGPGSVVVPHAAEITYVLAGTDNLEPGEERDLAIEMTTYWSNFARTGDPNGKDLAEWLRYGDNGDVVQRLQVQSEGGTKQQTELRKAACDFWDSHPSKLPVEYVLNRRGAAHLDVVVV